MLNISMTAENAREVEMSFAGFAKDVSNLTTVWPAVRAVLRSMVMERQFPSEGSQGAHGRFAPLSPRYAAWKLKHYGPKPILQRTGRLLRSFAEGSPEHVDRASERSLEWGSGVPYAIHHQWGYAKAFGGGRTRSILTTELARAIGAPAHPRGWSRKAFTRGQQVESRNVPARRPLDPKQSDIDDLRRAIQRGIVAMARRRGFAIAGNVYGPGETTGISGGEAFMIGKGSMER